MHILIYFTAKPRNHTSNKDDVYEVDEISLEEVEEEEEEELNTSSFSVI